MSWTEHVIWWHVYPLGFVGAPIREPDPTPESHRLRRIIGWLDHIIELGANGLMLGPIFASSTHGYDTLDHFRIDPRLGDEQDFIDLVAEARRRGIRVGLDGVFNHLSAQHPFVQSALAGSPGLGFAGWFHVDWNSSHGPAPTFFEGHESLVELNHQAAGVREYVADVLDYWTARGVDAWRLDAAYAVDPKFWQSVLPRVRSRHPGVWFVGEVIHGDYPGFTERSSIDSVTQYWLWNAIWTSLRDRNFFELDRALTAHNKMLRTFLPSTFIGNHDVTRIASMIGEDLVPLALAVLLTTAGVPTIYAGDEFGFTGVKQDRFGGDDEIRPEFPTSPHQLTRGDRLRDTHRDLIGIRRRNPWLHHAQTQPLKLTENEYAYIVRSSDSNANLRVQLRLAPTRRVEIFAADGSTLYRREPS